MMVLIGSEALRFHGFNVITKDVDIVGTYDDILSFSKKVGASTFIPINAGKHIKMVINGRIWEAEIAYPDSSAEDLINSVYDSGYDWTEYENNGFAVPSIDFLYTLKMSHRYLRNSPHFHKTMRDIYTLRKCGATIRDNLQEFYKRRMKTTYDYPHPKLNVMKNDFFAGDGVTYKFDHDWIHTVVKMTHKPAYEYFKPDDSQVMVSKEMWNDLPLNLKLCAVIEESMVLAIERSLIPFPNSLTEDQAYEKALVKVCTSITSGWFREFAWENYHIARVGYPAGFWNNFKKVANIS